MSTNPAESIWIFFFTIVYNVYTVKCFSVICWIPEKFLKATFRSTKLIGFDIHTRIVHTLLVRQKFHFIFFLYTRFPILLFLVAQIRELDNLRALILSWKNYNQLKSQCYRSLYIEINCFPWASKIFKWRSLKIEFIMSKLWKIIPDLDSSHKAQMNARNRWYRSEMFSSL